MGLVCARHGDRVVQVFQTVVGLVFDLAMGGLLLHADSKAATLNHEVSNHAVKNGVVVMARADIAQEISH